MISITLTVDSLQSIIRLGVKNGELSYGQEVQYLSYMLNTWYPAGDVLFREILGGRASLKEAE